LGCGKDSGAVGGCVDVALNAVCATFKRMRERFKRVFWPCSCAFSTVAMRSIPQHPFVLTNAFSSWME
jgi:hypothetical protein